MKKLYFIIFLILLTFHITYSQTKEIKGDTVFRYKRNIELQKTLNLKDFEKSSDEFNFRFRNHNQVIEISKDSSEFTGTITNFISHTKRPKTKKSETIYDKIILSSEQAENLYNIVQNSKILVLPSDKNIKNWHQGSDGATYNIEHSDKKEYWLKKYYSPYSQDSIPEAILVLDLVNNLSETLNLEEVSATFKNSLPKYGCYNFGGYGMCYSLNSLELGYSGASKLPLGFYLDYSATYIGKIKVNGSTALQYNFNNDGFHHLNLQIQRWHIFAKKSNLSDFLVYNYQNRMLNIDNIKSKFENHQINYGLRIEKNLAIGIGFDYLSNNYDEIGGLFFAKKWFTKPDISTAVTTSIFENQLNYKAEIFKSVYFKHCFLRDEVSFGIVYENFMHYNDLYFNVRLSI